MSINENYKTYHEKTKLAEKAHNILRSLAEQYKAGAEQLTAEYEERKAPVEIELRALKRECDSLDEEIKGFYEGEKTKTKSKLFVDERDFEEVVEQAESKTVLEELEEIEG